MSTQNNELVVSDAKVQSWVDAYATDEPLYKQFPLNLVNGKTVPGVRVICTTCEDRLTGDRLRGRVVQSLPHVVTVTANGYCHVCDRLTHVDCRFRANPGVTIVEWLRTNGTWQAREIRPSTLFERATGLVRRMRNAFAPAA